MPEIVEALRAISQQDRQDPAILAHFSSLQHLVRFAFYQYRSTLLISASESPEYALAKGIRRPLCQAAKLHFGLMVNIIIQHLFATRKGQGIAIHGYAIREATKAHMQKHPIKSWMSLTEELSNICS